MLTAACALSLADRMLLWQQNRDIRQQNTTGMVRYMVHMRSRSPNSTTAGTCQADSYHWSADNSQVQRSALKEQSPGTMEWHVNIP